MHLIDARRGLAALLVACGASMAFGCHGGGIDDSSGSPQAALGERASFEGLSFQVPASWTSEPPSSGMRLAQYRVGPAQGDPEGGECALFHFPGQGGSVQANLERWYGQFEQPDGGSTSERARVEKLGAGSLQVTLVDVSGTYVASMGPMSGGHGAQPRTGYRMVAGVVETAKGPWFLKCVGPEATLDAAAPAVRALLRSAHP